MQVSYAPAFLRLLGKLDAPVKASVKQAVGRVIDFYEGGNKATGLGVKRLRGNLWEARAGLHVRILYSLSSDRLRFILAGNHDDVPQFLKEN